MAFPFSRLLTVSTAAALLSLPLAARAATITVTQTTDSFDDGGCSLRDAVESVNNSADFSDCTATGGYNSDDTIILTAQTYTLSLPGDDDTNNFGDLDIFRPVTIRGAGSSQTTILGQYEAGTPDRILHIGEIDSGILDFLINLEGLTIRNGDAISTGSGGGIFFDRSNILANLTDVVVTENQSEDDGGGIAFSSLRGVLTLNNSQVRNNDSLFSTGGGISIDRGAVVQLIDSTVDGNSSRFAGGGIFNFATFIAVNSTISRNTASFTEDGDEGVGGGLFNIGGFVLINSTVSGNTARVDGGGIFTTDQRVATGNGDLENVQGLLYNVTIANNVAELGSGGGICSNCQVQPQGPLPIFGEVRINNTLIADNTADSSPDCISREPFVSGGYNLVGDADGCNGFTATGDQTNVEPGIGPLSQNGGPTETHALLLGSLAIDRGNDVEGCQFSDIEEIIDGNLVLQPLVEDQRGFTRPIAILNPNVAICDIGAYELQVEEPSPTPTPVPPPGPFLLEGSGFSCSLGFGGSSAGALSLAGFLAVAALFAAWRGFGLNRR